MSVALFFISHEGIASNLIEIGKAITQKKNSNLDYFEIPMDADTTLMTAAIENKLLQLDSKDGLLFITDIYGSTPSNIAQRIADKYNAELISGVNLPMIIRLLNYRENALSSITLKALDGAKQGLHIAGRKT